MDSDFADAGDDVATKESLLAEAPGGSGDEEPDKIEDAKDKQKSDQDKGKEEYNNGNYEEAIKAWTRSLKSVKYMLDKGFYKDKPEQLEEVHQINMRMNLNMAQGSLKIRDWRSAIEYADKVLERDAHHTKALWRKAQALIGLGRLKDGIAVLDALLRIEPENPAVKDLRAKTVRSNAEADRKASKAAKKMFASMEKDPRVPATIAERLLGYLRNAPAELRRYISELWEWAWDMFMDSIYFARDLVFSPLHWLRGMPARCRRRCKAFTSTVRGFLEGQKPRSKAE
mmetsp:Transcript_47652/g.74282  ORF Transcript_47652/g.74282 Transcript_47652/m.74282 type:complete len:285 (-) Transcript_47652:32-886(-)